MTATTGPSPPARASATSGVRGLGVGVEAVPALDGEGVLPQALVGRDRPQVDADAVGLGQLGRGGAGRALRRPGEQDRRPVGVVALRRVGPAVEAGVDVVVGDAVGLRRHHVVLVVEGEVVEDVLAGSAVHALDAALDDGAVS